MDSHARSLLERLNTSASPKSSKATTPEARASPSLADEPKDTDSSETVAPSLHTPSQNQRSSTAALQGPEATMSVKDLLVSARHRSRETSESESTVANPSTALNNTGAANDSIATDPNQSLPAVPETANQKLVVITSDGDSSGVAEEMPTTPGGSNNSSLASSGGPPRIASETTSSTRPQGVRALFLEKELDKSPTSQGHSVTTIVTSLVQRRNILCMLSKVSGRHSCANS